MEQTSVQAIIDALNRSGVRYLVVGGLAVVAHGVVRFTADVDLVLDPDPAALRRAIEALTALDYRPRAPVEFTQFADPGMRASWVRDKGLTVFSTFSPRHAATEIDLFVETPFDFEPVYTRCERFEVAPGIVGTFIGRNDLIEMKRKAGRPLDLQDAEGLREMGT